MTKHGKKVFLGRQAAKCLAYFNMLPPATRFDADVTSLDEWGEAEDEATKGLLLSEGVTTLLARIEAAKKSEKVIAAYHDFLLSTTNESYPLPIDASCNEKRYNETLFDPNGTTI